MKLKIKEGTTSKLAKIFVQDSSATDGAGLTGLVYNSAGLSGYWIAEGDAAVTNISLATATVGTYTNGGFKEVDNLKMPGVYEVGIPNAAIDNTSEGSTLVMYRGASNMAPVLLEIELDAIDYQDSVRAGLTAVPTGVDGYTPEEAMKLSLAALAGKVSGAGTTTVIFRSADDAKDRITATVDNNGNRSAITLDET